MHYQSLVQVTLLTIANQHSSNSRHYQRPRAHHMVIVCLHDGDCDYVLCSVHSMPLVSVKHHQSCSYTSSNGSCIHMYVSSFPYLHTLSFSLHSALLLLTQLHQLDITLQLGDLKLDITLYKLDITLQLWDLTMHKLDITLQLWDLTMHKLDITLYKLDITLQLWDLTMHKLDITLQLWDITLQQLGIILQLWDHTLHKSDIILQLWDLTLYQLDITQLQLQLDITQQQLQLDITLQL